MKKISRLLQQLKLQRHQPDATCHLRGFGRFGVPTRLLHIVYQYVQQRGEEHRKETNDTMGEETIDSRIE